MKFTASSRVLILSPAILSLSSAVVEAFNASPSNIHDAGATLTSTKLDAATLTVVSYEEDLALTRKIIMDHQERSTTVPTEQFIQQMEESAKPLELTTGERTLSVEEVVDVSVPYDAAARLAYESFSDKSTTSFDDFQTKYLAEAVAHVKSKQQKSEKEGVPLSAAVAIEATVTQIVSKDIPSDATTTETMSEEVSSEGETVQKSLLNNILTWVGNKLPKRNNVDQE